MLSMRDLYKVVIMSVFLGSQVFAESDSQKIQNAVCIITSQDMQQISAQKYKEAWTAIISLVNKGLGEYEAKKVISSTIDRYKDLWKNINCKSFWIRFDISCSLHLVMRLAACCVKQGFYYDEAIELVRLMGNYIDAPEYTELVENLLDTKCGPQELEQIVREEILFPRSTYRIDKALTIYGCFASRNLLINEAFLAVKKSLEYCSDGIFGSANNNYIMETSLKVLIVLVKKGYFIEDAFKILACCMNGFFGVPITELHDIFMCLADYDSHSQEFLQLMNQAISSNNPRVRECILNALSYIVIYKGQLLDEAYQAATQSFIDYDEHVRCSAMQLFIGLAHRDMYMYNAINIMHTAEESDNDNIRDGAHYLRCILAARGYLLEESLVLAQSETITDEKALEIYQALVGSGHYLNEALEKVKKVIEQDYSDESGILALLASLFLQNYEISEVKRCAMICMKKLDDDYSYKDEFDAFAYNNILAKKRHDLLISYRQRSAKIQNFGETCKIFFKGLFTSPDLAYAKEFCEKELCKESIDPTMFTEILFLQKSEECSYCPQSLTVFTSREWISYGSSDTLTHLSYY